MIKIIGRKVIDLIAFRQGILFVLKEQIPNGQYKVSFYSYDLQTQSIATVTKNAYQMTKFGSAYEAIVPHLEDYISCAAQRLSDGKTFIVYSSGEIGIFAENGELLFTDHATYNHSSVREAAAVGNHVWCTVPNENAIVRYNTSKKRIDMRLGERNDATFERPVFISAADKTLFVSCKNGHCVNSVSLDDFSVTKSHTFNEPVLEYFRVADSEFAVLESGIYLL
ncbi:MAG: hypothetical protein IKM24_05150 [Clostridia bacterium]|nr:hypothetical protein [Clostridia bacterium]